MNKILVTICALALPLTLGAQGLNLDRLDRLAAKASSSVNVTLDESLLKLAAGFVDPDDAEAADVKKVVAGLKGIYVRSFEFKTPGQYDLADIEELRVQLRDPEWKRIVQVKNKPEGDADVYIRTRGGSVTGLAVISAEPKQLTVVSIDGHIDPESFRKLSGNFGIPKNIGKKEDKTK